MEGIVEGCCEVEGGEGGCHCLGVAACVVEDASLAVAGYHEPGGVGMGCEVVDGDVDERVVGVGDIVAVVGVGAQQGMEGCAASAQRGGVDGVEDGCGRVGSGHHKGLGACEAPVGFGIGAGGEQQGE